MLLKYVRIIVGVQIFFVIDLIIFFYISLFCFVFIVDDVGKEKIKYYLKK